MKIPSRLSSVVLYSVISAAFIGPGTITTAITAGATQQLQLLWAVTLGTLGCLVVQEVSARIVISSGLNLRQATQKCYGQKIGFGFMVIVGGSVMAGCAAYQAGNIMGAVAGLNLLTGVDEKLLTLCIAIFAFIILWTDKRQLISWLMTGLVGLMGVAFFDLAFRQSFSFSAIISGAIIPTIPSGSEMLVLGLIGTTIVPYNIFLGSGISKGNTIPLMRVGLAVSVVMGGIITGAILIAGTSVNVFASFPELAVSLKENLGSVGSLSLGIGLFAAGLSSSITAPYASSLIASTLFGWEDKTKMRWVWAIILATGFAFGVSGIKPIPVILTVQALNGLILPLLVGLLALLSNHKLLVPVENRNSLLFNSLLLFILGSVLLIGLNQVDKSLISFGVFPESHSYLIIGLAAIVVMLTAIFIFRMRINVKDKF